MTDELDDGCHACRRINAMPTHCSCSDCTAIRKSGVAVIVGLNFGGLMLLVLFVGILLARVIKWILP